MTRLFAVLTAALTLLAGPAGAADQPKFSQAQLEEMIAPIALYPDDVLSTVCIAATYPLEVVEADRWRDKNAALQGTALEQALATEDWDASVKSLTSLPDVLDRMSDDLDWTKDLGDAFLAQRSELMDAAQRLRGKAYEAGTLKTTPQQTVVKDDTEKIAIQPTDPQTVYVPSYAPGTVYGPTYTAPATPTYPSFWGSPTGSATAGVLGFGAGIATTALIGSLFDWNDNDVYIPPYYAGGGAYRYGGGGDVVVNRNVKVNADVNRANVRTNRQKWNHDGSHRRGVGYRDQATEKRFGGRDRLAAANQPDRKTARGFEPKRPDRGGDGQRLGGAGAGKRPDGGRLEGRRPGGDKPDGRPSGGRPDRPQRPDGPRKDARPTARPEARPANKPSGAFGDAAGGARAREASRRGAASRGVQSRAGSGAVAKAKGAGPRGGAGGLGHGGGAGGRGRGGGGHGGGGRRGGGGGHGGGRRGKK